MGLSEIIETKKHIKNHKFYAVRDAVSPWQ
jgi:hypothetical protein